MRIGSLLPLINFHPMQSYQYKWYRPLGSLQLIVSGMSRKKIDEIAIININTKTKIQFNQGLEVLRKMNCDTPLLYGGGVRGEYIDDFRLDVIERVVVSNAIIEKDELLISQLHDKFGRQAVVGLLPLLIKDQDALVLNTRDSSLTRLNNDISYLYEYCDEIVVVDVLAEGVGSFDFNLLKLSNFRLERTLICGGCGDDEIDIGKRLGLAGVYIDNRYLHNEKHWSIR
jgi:phosphoribosylformimino-5-aminoimidazole carboxamide ribonucleotide (ProFAR) isomerase